MDCGETISGSDPKIVGKTIQLGDEAYVVSGVLGPSFYFDPPADVYLPMQADPNSVDQSHYFQATARLNPGVTLAMAQAAMKQAAAEFERKFPGALGGQGNSFTALPMRETVVGDVRTSLLRLAGSGRLRAADCVRERGESVARARDASSPRDRDSRRAGGGRRRIVGQLLTESVLLSLAGGVLGLVLGYFGVHALFAINPVNIPRIGEYGRAYPMDWRVLAFTLAVSILTGLLFGLIPAFGASKADLNVTLRESGSRSGTGLRQNKARAVLVVAETALALILLVGAALLIRTFQVLRGVNSRASTHNVLTMDMSRSPVRDFRETIGVAQIGEEMRAARGSSAGVEATATTCCLPLEGGVDCRSRSRAVRRRTGRITATQGYDIVSWEYFPVFRIPVLQRADVHRA